MERRRSNESALKPNKMLKELHNLLRCTARTSMLVSFDDVAALLDVPYSYYDSKPMVDALVIPCVEVRGELSVTTLTISQLPAVVAGIEAIKSEDNIDLLAFWPDFGYATFDQLEAMLSQIETRSRSILVIKTRKWTDELEWLGSDIRNPFADMIHVTKSKHKGYVETLNLSVNRTVNPRFHDFASPEQKRRSAGGLALSIGRILIGIFNVGGHWVAFRINKKLGAVTNKATCFMCDPLRSERNYTIIEKSVRTVIEVIHMEGFVMYEKVDWCTQQDSTSCGVCCIAVLEMLLTESSWNDSLYNVQPYQRMRLLHKAIAFVENEAALLKI
ncbi:LOW QUALITY PROTEIN: hypothetical protein PHMEG_0007001 [Phytophthora megakarya]|uniref:Ubiquitin-like protease family profile domain-containing protein n=1 Tax=Phytophthora megakarya TaxID=4795 RepID=A0A225WMF9_9STRA|nr:LOW QUALITY PROTEIN: hypothetical protein PHMEG_0007001 [Phytophthora megakarya]